MDLEAISDFHYMKTITPLKKKVSNPFNFRSASMVTTFVCSAGSRTQFIWKFMKKANQINAGVKQAELEYPLLEKM